MRTLIDIPEEQIRSLDYLARADGRSRAAVIREAVDRYLARRKRAGFTHDAFGAWGAGEDGIAYQERMRGEWRG